MLRHQLKVLDEQTLAKVRLDPTELSALGRARGQAVEKALLHDGSLDARRVLLSTEGKVEEDDHRVRYELEIAPR